MAFNSGTGVTDHVAMMDKMIEVVTARFLASATVNSGGSGHAAGDIIEITAAGSTSTEVARLEVTAVSSGAITGVRVYRAGAYTVDPTTTTGNAQSGTSGSGTGATFDLTFSAPVWALNRRSQKAISATVAAGGTGYAVNDTITLLGGVVGGDGSAATFNVDSVSGGVVTAVSLVSEGLYEERPADAVSTTGGGAGCTLNVTFQDSLFADSTFQVCMLQGEGLAGTDEVHVGLKAYSAANSFNTAYNWQMFGMTGYSDTLPIHQQPGFLASWLDSDGTLKSTDTDAAVMVLKNNDANNDISWWINHNGRRIILVCKVEGASSTIYSSCYLGLLNQFGTDGEYPYPLAVIGGTNNQNRLWTDTTLLTGGIVESFSNSSQDPVGPGFLRLPSGDWYRFASATSPSSSNRTLENEFGVYPFVLPTQVPVPGQTVALTSAVNFAGGTAPVIPSSSVPGTPGVQLKPTPGTSGDRYLLIAPIVGRWENSAPNLYPDGHRLWGEMDGTFWFATGNNVVASEDRHEDGNKRYTIFQNGNRTQVWSYFALDED